MDTNLKCWDMKKTVENLLGRKPKISLCFLDDHESIYLIPVNWFRDRMVFGFLHNEVALS